MSNEEEEYSDPPPEALSGNVQGGGTDVLADLLLMLIAETIKAGVMLAECDEDEFNSIKKRLKQFRHAVGILPDKPTPKRRVGFRVEKMRKR